MVSKRMNVLVYSGTGSTLESVRHCLFSSRRLLSPNYAVLTVTGDTLLEQPWQSTCALLVLPGGADLGYCATLNGRGNRLIRQYVNSGGSYLGLCAGGYYGSARCEFEVGDPQLEVIGSRELEFYPGTARGSTFKGFVYNSEQGTAAATLTINKASFAGVSTAESMPDSFRAYSNGGSVFIDARKFADRGVEVLATYADVPDIEDGENAAAIIYRKIGEGHVILTGPHPEFAGSNLNKKAQGADAIVIDALIDDDQQRKIFLKACLAKLGLSVNETDEEPPSLSQIHFSTASGGVTATLEAWQSITAKIADESYLKGEHDTFKLEEPSSAWSMSELVQTIPLVSLSDSGAGTEESEHSGIADPTTAVKRIVTHISGLPKAKATPYFNHSAYFANLAGYTDYTAQHADPATRIGQHLLYGEVVTSTSTLLEKNPSLTNHLPMGTTFTATTQLSGRGRGSNVWVSPAGSLMFSFLLRHPLRLNATAPIVFLQYLAALAVAEGVQTYDVEGVDPVHLITTTSGRSSSRSRSAYRAVPIALKWPNDIYALAPDKLLGSSSSTHAPDRNNYVKIGGILVNTSYAGGDYTAIVGIGLNTSNAAPTTSLNALVDALTLARPASQRLKPYTLEKLLARILSVFEALYTHFCEHGFSGRLETCYEKHWLHKDQIVVLEEEGGVTARIKGITRDWGLLRAEEVREVKSDGPEEQRYIATGKEFALQSDSNSFDFFKGLVKRKL